MENKKIKTTEYQPIEKFNLAKNLDKFAILKLCNKHSTYKKLAVQWLNEALCFVSSFVVADSLVLRNRQLLVAAKRCA